MLKYLKNWKKQVPNKKSILVLWFSKSFVRFGYWSVERLNG